MAARSSVRSKPLDPWPEDDEGRDAWAVELAKRVEWWQQELLPLGVAHFRIDHVSLEESVTNARQDSAVAGVHYADDYDTCSFTFSVENFTELDSRRKDEVIVHEWLHVSFREYEQAIRLSEDQLSDPLQEMWEDALEHAQEGIIERLSRLIVSKVVN